MAQLGARAQGKVMALGAREEGRQVRTLRAPPMERWGEGAAQWSPVEGSVLEG